MSKTVAMTEKVIVVSKGKEDIGKLVALGNDGKFDPSVIPPIAITGSVAEIDGDNTVHITHADGSTTIGAAKQKYDVLWSGNVGTEGSTVVTSLLTLSQPITLEKYRKIGIRTMVHGNNSVNARRPQYREFLVEDYFEMLSQVSPITLTLSSVWGFSGDNVNLSDYCDLYLPATNSTVTVRNRLSFIREIRGIY